MLQDTLSLTLDAESAQRGYALVQSDTYLMDNFSAVTHLRGAMIEVKELTKDNPVQYERVIALDKLIGTKIDQMRAGINFVRTIDQATALENYTSGATQTVENEIRTAIQVLLEEEDRLFGIRQADVGRAEQMRVITFIVLLVLFAGVADIYFTTTNRNIVARNAMLDELSDAKRKTERADRFKGDLLNHLGGALHTPLTGITSQSDLLLYRATDALSD